MKQPYNHTQMLNEKGAINKGVRVYQKNNQPYYYTWVLDNNESIYEGWLFFLGIILCFIFQDIILWSINYELRIINYELERSDLTAI